MTARRSILADGRSWFSHGPIDLIILADGDATSCGRAHALAWDRFVGILEELTRELPQLKRALDTDPATVQNPFHGQVAQRMWNACRPFSSTFITPMAAVAGGVADELIEFYRRDGIECALINNGGDIAIHLGANAQCRIAVCADIETFHATRGHAWDGQITITSQDLARGVATSGWRGRSFSLGIADSVTVVAQNAARADAAATLLGNAVNIDDARIRRRPASSLKDDTDLGSILVTVDVPALSAAAVDHALNQGLAQARAFFEDELILGAALFLQGERRVIGSLALGPPDVNRVRRKADLLALEQSQ